MMRRPDAGGEGNGGLLHPEKPSVRVRNYITSAKRLSVLPTGRKDDPMITIVAKCSARAGRADELVQLALNLIDSSRKEEGNVSYDFYTDIADPTKFTFIEVWKDQAAIDLHNSTPHFQGFVEKAGPLFAGPLDVSLYQKIS